MMKKRIFIALTAMSLAAVLLCTGCSSTENADQITTEARAAEKTTEEKKTEKETVRTEVSTETEKKTAGTTASTSSANKASTKLTMRVGLSESSINDTEFERYTLKDGGYVGSWKHARHYAYDYYWKDSSGKLLLKVHTFDGKVDYIIQNAVTYDKDSKITSVHPVSGSSSGSSSSKSYSYKSSSSGTGNSSGKSSSKSYTRSAGGYDDGYNAIYDDDDYDWNRYRTDDDYARGVDDAMDELEDDW